MSILWLWTQVYECTFLPLIFSVPEQKPCHEEILIRNASFVSAFTLFVCTLKCVRAAATGNPMKSLHTDQNDHPNLRHCQIHSMSHQSPANRYVMPTILTNMSTDAHSSCMQCYLARANITCMPIAKTVPKCASRNRTLASHNSGAGTA
jgi:hypothetical protein